MLKEFGNGTRINNLHHDLSLYRNSYRHGNRETQIIMFKKYYILILLLSCFNAYGKVKYFKEKRNSSTECVAIAGNPSIVDNLCKTTLFLDENNKEQQKTVDVCYLSGSKRTSTIDCKVYEEVKEKGCTHKELRY